MSPGIESFLEQYKNRNWRIHSLILSLNFKTKDKQTILLMLLEELRTQIKNRRSAKKDDLEFIFRIMSFLESKQQLPFSSAIFAYDIFAELSFEVDKRSLENTIVEIGEQKSNYIVNRMYESLILALNPILDIEQTETIEAKITYRSKPKTTTLEYVDNVFLIAGSESSEAILVEAREGSWIEIIRMSIESLFAFYVALYLVNGCLVQLTMMRAGQKILLRSVCLQSFYRQHLAHHMNCLKAIVISFKNLFFRNCLAIRPRLKLCHLCLEKMLMK